MVLENEFMSNSYITRQKRWEISCKLHLTERQVRAVRACVGVCVRERRGGEEVGLEGRRSWAG